MNMNMVDRIDRLDMAVQMQYSTMETGRVRVVCCMELVDWKNGKQEK